MLLPILFAGILTISAGPEECFTEFLKVPPKQIDELQRQVDSGHQPWRLDSRLVAQAALSEWLKKNANVGSGTKAKEFRSREGKLTATHCYDFGLETVTVHLKRRDEKAIWVADRIERCFELPVTN